ncbi:MAG: carbohydrate kinase, partial [Pyramidobacter sp.]|nr:carbohydrate kinase [Pyramidobacter sp.]
MPDVVALGELLIDFAPQSVNEAGYPTLAANPGGAPGNFLAALAKYGCSTAMIGKVGEDAFGRLLVKTLRDAGIDTQGVMTDPEVFT